MEKAYIKAKEGGYEGRLYAPKLGAELHDPKFWQALAKVEDKEVSCIEYYPNHECGCGVTHHRAIVWWKAQMHRFVDHIAEGKDVDSFFDSLLSK